jgi:hypothetical protein
MRTSAILICGALFLACGGSGGDKKGGSGGSDETGGEGGSGPDNTGGKPSTGGAGPSTGGDSGGSTGGSSGGNNNGGSSGGNLDAATNTNSTPDAGATSADAGNPATTGPGLHKIFDGTTLTGWTSTPAGMFKVQDGALVATGKGRGAFATNEKYTHYRILFSLKPGGTGGHAPTVLVFCNFPGRDALGGIQFQPPNGGHWDYRPGKNNSGGALFMKIGPSGPADMGWYKCEIVANAKTGEAKMACGGKDVLHFKDPTAGMGMAAPFAIQTHNGGITDAYKDLSVEDNITDDNYTTVK